MKNSRVRRAVVLLSGGLDSAVSLYLARKKGFECHCLIFDYGQRHKKEIVAAAKIARRAHCHFRIIKISLPWKGSALLDKKISVPERDNGTTGQRDNGIPDTYVPARNIIFLSFAFSYAEALAAEAVFIGAHIHDYSGYPDCRPEFYRQFKRAIDVGTKAGVEKKKIALSTPLIHKNKAEIIALGASLGVPFKLTWSCYRGGAMPCGKCDSCFYRAKGFRQAGIADFYAASKVVR